MFPIWWTTRDDRNQRRSTIAFPMWWSSHNKSERTRSLVLFPLWWDFRNDREQTRRSALLPLAWHSIDKARDTREIALFPTFRWRAAPNELSWSLWPLCSRERSAEERAASVAWPFFAFSRSLKTGRKEAWFPFPLAGWETDPARAYRHFQLLPFWSDSEREDRLATLFPLAWWRRHGQFRGSAWLWYIGKPRDKELTRRHLVLWKLLTYEKRRDGHHDFRFLHKLVHSQSTKGYSSFAINPLVCSEHDAGLYRFSILGPTLQYEKDQGKRRLRLLQFLSIPLP